ncbi:hypothetical protein [Streptomyces albus]|uniref:hypothetical protein n=1 Tax=Streptomyces albus TaxID=1888 RepID=UPI0033FE4E9E
MRPITLGRWTVDLYARTIRIHRGPNPNCRQCSGEGGYETLTVGPAPEPTYELCGCWNPDHGLRIPLVARKRRETLEVPF